jgi:uncharacterized protein YlxW (UPF0749 family)
LKKEKVAIMFGIICIVLTFVIAIQIRTVDDMSQDVGLNFRDNGKLIDEYRKTRDRHNDSQKTLRKLELNLEKARNEASQGNENDIWMEEEIRASSRMLGLTDVSGSGVKITLDDNREVNPNEVFNISNYLVHEADIVAIVNELFNAGADAISINGHRVVHTTSIYCDGNIVRINNERTGVPIVINAIGRPERMELALIRPAGYVSLMREEGVPVSVEKMDTIKISRFSGVFSYNHIIR